MSAFLAILLVLWITIMAWKHVGECSFSYSLPAVNLVHAQTATPQPKADREDAMTVSITQDGMIYFRGIRVSQGKLKDEIVEAIRGGAERRVYFSVDRRARYGLVDEVSQVIRSAEIGQVTFLTALPRQDETQGLPIGRLDGK